MNRFSEKLRSLPHVLKKIELEILQVNLGRFCNLTCSHCHVEAGPTKTAENMDRKTAEAIVSFLKSSGIKILDITGGAPEMNPHFRYLVQEASGLQVHVIDRCNLTVFYEAGHQGSPDFLASHGVEVIASLPCYEEANVDRQRGKGTFEMSIEALKWLNRLGYAKEKSGLVLNLVYNPVGAHLPPPQEKLENDYKLRLWEDFEIVFNRLYTITNMPITRYAAYLKATQQYESYVNLLARSFNEVTLDGLMCRNTLSVGWDGRLYDCDFNLALGMSLGNGRVFSIFDVMQGDLENSTILTGDHCFGCTAGTGSSCQGSLS